MEEAAAALEFERAARLRDKIARLQQLQSRQFVESATAGDIDVVAAASERRPVRGQRRDDPRRPPRRRPHVLSAPRRRRRPDGVGEIVPAFLEQHYVERPVPPTIVVPDADDHAALAEVLSAQSRAQGRDRRQSRRRAPRVARDGAAERDAGDPPAARAEGDAGGPAGRAAGGARPAAVRAAHRVLRRVAHDGRGGGRVVRDLRPARDADAASTAAST